MIWPPCGTVLTGGMHDDLTAMVLCWLVDCMMVWPPWYCADWWNAWWSDHHVVLCWLVECTMIWAPWYCADWWNVRWSDHHVVLCWLVECTMIWPPCGTVLTGGIHGDLTTMWYCVNWCNTRWSDHHVVLCWLVDCTMIWPPCGTVFTGGMHNDLTTMWHCVHWWNAQWSDHHVALCSLVKCTMIWVNFSLYMILICLIWLQLLSHVISEHVPWHHSEFVFKIHHFGSIATFQLLQKHGSQSLGFLCQILILTLWFTQVLRWFA